MNDAMSFGIHRLWKDHFVRNVLSPGEDTRVLDVAGGTGDIAMKILDRGAAEVVCSDINPSMLEVGKKRAETWEEEKRERIRWEVANAEELPFEDESFDAYTIAFGIRNVTRIEKARKKTNTQPCNCSHKARLYSRP